MSLHHVIHICRKVECGASECYTFFVSVKRNEGKLIEGEKFLKKMRKKGENII